MQEPLQLYQWVDAQRHASFAMGCLCTFEGRALPSDLSKVSGIDENVVDYVERLLEERGEVATRAHAVFLPEEYYWLINFCQTFQKHIEAWAPLDEESEIPTGE